MMKQPMNSAPDHDPMKIFGKQARELPMPKQLRERNRAAIQTSLTETASKQSPPLWWQRRVAVPLPLAAAVLVLLAFQFVWLMELVASNKEVEDSLAGQPETESHYMETSVYVAGIGTIERSQINMH